jgi:ABC-2 type transport system permease protein
MTGKPKHRRVATLTHIGIMTKYNFLNYLRARRFYVMLTIVLFIAGALTIAIAWRRPQALLGGDALGFYGAGWGTFAGIIVLLSAAFFGGDAISGEYQNRTGYFLIPNPIRRSAVYAGKWFAALIASTMILLVYVVILMANGLYYFPSSLPWGFLQSVLYAWIYLVAALSLAFAFSSLFKSSAISVLMLVIMLLFVFDVVDILSSTILGIEPWFSITYGAGIISSVLQETYPKHIQTITEGTGKHAFTLTTYTASVPEGLAILLGYFVVMAIFGLWLFERKEFTS